MPHRMDEAHIIRTWGTSRVDLYCYYNDVQHSVAVGVWGGCGDTEPAAYAPHSKLTISRRWCEATAPKVSSSVSALHLARRHHSDRRASMMWTMVRIDAPRILWLNRQLCAARPEVSITSYGWLDMSSRARCYTPLGVLIFHTLQSHHKDH